MMIHNLHFLFKEMDTSILYDNVFIIYMLNLPLAFFKYIKLIAYKTLYPLVFVVVKSEYNLVCTWDIYMHVLHTYMHRIPFMSK